jgi:hypothetical protein
MDILCNVEHWVNWSRHFGPASGSDPKLKNPREKYILTTFAYRCNLGSFQAARHMREDVTGSVLSYTNQRHITAKKIDQAMKDIINHYHHGFDLPKPWGTGIPASGRYNFLSIEIFKTRHQFKTKQVRESKSNYALSMCVYIISIYFHIRTVTKNPFHHGCYF